MGADLQPCGHAVSEIVHGSHGSHCGACERELLASTRQPPKQNGQLLAVGAEEPVDLDGLDHHHVQDALEDHDGDELPPEPSPVAARPNLGPVNDDGTPVPDGQCHGTVFDGNTREWRRCNTAFKKPGNTTLYCKRHIPKPAQMQIPESVKSALAEVLGRSAAQVEQLWVELLASKSERIRLDALKALTTAATTLASKSSGPGRGSTWPKTLAEFEAMTWDEKRGAVLGYYAMSFQACYERTGNEQAAVKAFIATHAWNPVELAMMRSAVQALPAAV
jgi:hypothetical protein